MIKLVEDKEKHELNTTISALSLEVENLEKSLADKDTQIEVLRKTIEELRKKLNEPEQLTEKTGDLNKKDPLEGVTPGELLVIARKHGAV